jgi:hypothetical protein
VLVLEIVIMIEFSLQDLHGPHDDIVALAIVSHAFIGVGIRRHPVVDQCLHARYRVSGEL